MSAYCDRFQFDPEKSALENFFNLVYRNNKIKLTDADVDIGTPRPVIEDDGDNTIVLVTSKESGPLEGADDLYYARADLDKYYPVFTIDAEKLEGVNDKAALIEYIDNQFNLIDGEFDLDLEDPIGSLLYYTSIDLIAKPDSLVYIGKKSISIFWSGGLRRADEEGRIRVTEDGLVRVPQLE